MWLEVGDQQLHLFQRDTPAPEFHHIGLDVDDFEAAYTRRARARALRPRRVVAQRARAQRRRRADVPARPRGQPRRGQLARREHARSLGRDGHDEHRRRASAERRGDARERSIRCAKCRRSSRCRAKYRFSIVLLATWFGLRLRSRRVTGFAAYGSLRHVGRAVLLALVVFPVDLGALHRLGHELRARGPRPEGLPHHAAERAHRGGALLRRRQRLHADLRPDARRQHGPRRVLPARRLHRAAAPAQHGRRRRRRSGCRAPR